MSEEERLLRRLVDASDLLRWAIDDEPGHAVSDRTMKAHAELVLAVLKARSWVFRQDMLRQMRMANASPVSETQQKINERGSALIRGGLCYNGSDDA